MKNQDRCKDCIYRAPPQACYRCNYFTCTGHTRRAIPAEHCPYYQKGEQIEEARVPVTLPQHAWAKYDWVKGRKLYDQGKTDQAIAKALGCTAKGVQSWRSRNGLPAHRPRKGHWSKYDWSQAQKLYDQGKTDQEIATEMGASRAAVGLWRRQQGLPARRHRR